MAKVPFTVEEGIKPGETSVDIGTTDDKFNNVNVANDITIADGGSITVGGAELTDTTSTIAYSIALGQDNGKEIHSRKLQI